MNFTFKNLEVVHEFAEAVYSLRYCEDEARVRAYRVVDAVSYADNEVSTLFSALIKNWKK